MNSSISSFRGLTACFLIAAALTLAVIIGACEWLVRAKVAPEDSMFKHIALFNATSSPYAAFGDSHVARGFDAAAPVVNFGYHSENIEQMAWKADRYLQHTPQPKVVLLQADPHLFSEYRLKEGLGSYPQLFSRGRFPVLLSLSDLYRPQLMALWRAFVGNRGRLMSDVEFTPQGALLSPGNLSIWGDRRLEAFITIRAALHEPVAGFAQSEHAAAYERMVGQFLDAGATICLVAFPIAPVYRDQVVSQDAESEAAFERAMGFFQKFAASPNVHFVDHRTLYNDPSLYRDPDHLNKTGARLYGPVLQEACFGEEVVFSAAVVN